jgi:hypothetical protein
MASASPSLPLTQASVPLTPSFWSRESASLKQGIKTGLAGTIAYALYTGWHLPPGYWAVAALVVTQANLSASWKAALYRTIGSTAGALAAALLMPMLGKGPLAVGLVWFVLASFFGYLTALHPSLQLEGSCSESEAGGIPAPRTGLREWKARRQCPRLSARARRMNGRVREEAELEALASQRLQKGLP